MLNAETTPTSVPTVETPHPELREIWVLLWSQSQCALHVESLRDMQRANLEALHDDRRMDYVPLLIAAREEVDEAAEAIRPLIRKRQEERSALAVH